MPPQGKFRHSVLRRFSEKIEYAPVMELVDMRDLGSRAAKRVGSSPFRRTTSEQALYRLLRLILCRNTLLAAPFQIEPAAPGFDLFF